MSIRTMAGTYNAGYSLKAAFSGATITDTGRVFGSGLAVGTATISNFGTIASTGGSGFTGLTASGYAELTNAGLIAGGGGGFTTDSYTGYYVGQAGGAGVSLAASGAVTNNATILGGGGAGGDDFESGGGGGAGLTAAGATTVTNNGTIGGGTGAFSRYAGGGGGVGVNLAAGGDVANAGRISGGAGGLAEIFGDGGGGGVGVQLAGGAGLSNIGTIVGGGGGAGGEARFIQVPPSAYDYRGGAGGVGVELMASASLYNAGSIAGGAGGASAKHNGQYVAYSAAGGAGVLLQAGGTLSNQGTIAGGQAGAGVPPPNYRYYNGEPGDGVVLAAVCTVVNGSDVHTAAAIGGYFGVYAGAGSAATIDSYGVITGTSGTSVRFMSALDRLIVESGAVFNGAVAGGGGALELHGHGIITALGGAATLSRATSMSFGGFGTYVIDGAASWYLDGASVLASGKHIDNDGGLTLYGGLENHGSITGGAGFTAGYFSGTGGRGTTAIYVYSGATLTNFAGGHIKGGAGGAGYYGGFYPGLVSGPGGVGGTGARLTGGLFHNNAGGVVTGGVGGVGGDSETSGAGGSGGAGVKASGAAHIVNAGKITGGAGGAGGYLSHAYPGGAGGAGGAGVILAGGVLTNTGTVNGGAGGAGAGGGANGVAGDGVDIFGDATVVNGSASAQTAVLRGLIGVYAGPGGAATVTNFGTIDGTGGTSVSFHSASDRLISESGATFTGSVAGGGGTLELANGTGTISGLGGAGTLAGAVAMSFSGFDHVVIDGAASWTVAGPATLGSGQSLVDRGTLAVTGALGGAGALSLAGGSTSFSTGSSLTIATVSQSGTAAATFNDNLAYAGVWTETAGAISVAGGKTLSFTGTGEVFCGSLGGAGTIALAGGTDRLAGTTIAGGAHLTIGAATVTLAGTIANSGTITATTPGLVVGAGLGATLTGGGHLTLTDAATNKITGSTAAAVLTNVDNLISGGGQLGGSKMTLVNQAAGRITGNAATAALVINTGTNAIQNAGTITAAAGGGVKVQSAIDNTSLLVAIGGVLTLAKDVIGAGAAHINTGGEIIAAGAFNENVSFTGASGMLHLAPAQAYAGKISGFSHAGTTSLDLRDIEFVSAGEATFSGNHSGGTLTVVDATHIAKIKLVGDYTAATFTASSDGHGGTIVVDPLVSKFVAAAAAAPAAKARSHPRPP